VRTYFAASAPLLRNGDLVETPVVTGLDWSRGGGFQLEKGCVAVRHILDYNVYWAPDDSPAAAVSECEGYATYRRVDQNDSATINAAVDLFSEDWAHLEFWRTSTTFSVVPTLTWADTNDRVWRGRWDSKVKRKLTSEDELRIGFATAAVAGGGVSNVLFSGLSQVLLTLP